MFFILSTLLLPSCLFWVLVRYYNTSSHSVHGLYKIFPILSYSILVGSVLFLASFFHSITSLVFIWNLSTLVSYSTDANPPLQIHRLFLTIIRLHTIEVVFCFHSFQIPYSVLSQTWIHCIQGFSLKPCCITYNDMIRSCCMLIRMFHSLIFQITQCSPVVPPCCLSSQYLTLPQTFYIEVQLNNKVYPCALDVPVN